MGVFFSSRRRHTRYWRDWSSAVCSSDLASEPGGFATGPVGHRGPMPTTRPPSAALAGPSSGPLPTRRAGVLLHVTSLPSADRKSVVLGKSVALGGRRILKNKKIVLDLQR